MSLKRRILKGVVSQFHRPHGLGGYAAGWVMAHRSSNRERNRWVVSLLDLEPTDRVLEIGFGPGLAIEAASRAVPRGKVYGIDHSVAMVRRARSRNRAAIRDGRVELKLGSADDLPVLGEPLDVVFAVNSMRFWSDYAACFEGLRNRMRPGGRIAIASQPRCPGASSETSRQAAQQIEAAVTAAGFVAARTETLELDPPVVCVISTRAAGPEERRR
jgi:ubiquinone/menaquinone biosynthesis C-methylase UbiE